MAKKERKKTCEGGEAWLVTFTDMMTLMLTFFILLVSMAVVDEQRRLIVLGSIIGTFGVADKGYDPRSTTNSKRTVEPGPLNEMDDLEALKERLWEDLENDLNFQSNRFVQILSINDQVLFEPGESDLKPEGKTLLDRLLPLLLQVDYPLLLGGHTSTMRDEQGEDYRVLLGDKSLDPSWRLSSYRNQAVYRYFLSRGFPSGQLRLEAFGRYRPRFPDNTADGRRRNRRVDIVLDKRNGRLLSDVENVNRAKNKTPTDYDYKDFHFNLQEPERGPQKPLRIE